MSETKCCIHLRKVPNSLPVRVFTDSTLAKCRAVRVHNTKHKNVILPDRVNTVDGYHVSCYRSFTGILMENTDKGANGAEGNKKKCFCYFVICTCHWLYVHTQSDIYVINGQNSKYSAI